MFNSEKRRYSRKVTVLTKDAYNQDIPKYLDQPDIEMFVSLIEQDQLVQNDMRIQQSTHIGLTHDAVLTGDIIGDRYEVTYVNNAGRESVVFMRDRESNGSNC